LYRRCAGWVPTWHLERADLLARNVATLSPPHDFLDSHRAAWVADPEGNPVQIVTRR